MRNSAKVVMGALTLVGITGMYLRQVRQVGAVGLVGYLLFGAGYLLMFATEVISGLRPPGPGEPCTGLRRRHPRRRHGWHARRRHRRDEDRARCHRRRLHGRRPRSSASPCSGPASWPAGRRPSSP
ncbi:MAG: hypothetical protein MZU95_09440 [Desulfomicrobium escambiense]|nr:hypothetical protein [Desulfomicrobium escambiense]